MSATIAIVTGTPDRKGPSTDGGSTYPTIPGKMSSSDRVESGEAILFDMMIGLTDGSIRPPFEGNENDQRSGVTWHKLTPNWVAGTVANLSYGTTDRVAVIDLDNANGLDVLKVINWVNHIEGAKLPD
ncbi:hypothetical protein I5G63_gp093 [Mycobacterium phage Imvubu]|uniref:Uncharacterized protein n=1 Tax=Mycobacterium phage Imvubu TaxID=2686233 RepID=A0A6B9LA15_9CAUD|nr:hypothetical protein I5G63_gp093 [Mycobacterium phage Imvubu]QHB37833.1 hypothetical protein PBI_IMVUBU_93 [Mycobacterium phage Imvubu]